MNIEYREPNSVSELAALFKLRYEVYRNDEELYKMIGSSTHDINSFDSKSWHFGAFHEGKAIGYVRLATLHPTTFAPWVDEIVKSIDVKIEVNSNDFPFQTFYPDIEWSKSFIEEIRQRNIGEVGKLAILKDQRKGDVIMHGLISSFLQYCTKKHKIETGFGSCSIVLERYYRKFGFYMPDGVRSFTYKDLPEAIILRFDP